MPIRSTASSSTAPSTSGYPALYQGRSGSIWLMLSDREGVILHLSASPQKTKHHVGYRSHKMKVRDMAAYKGEVKLVA